jgi:hypothetical protein
MRRNYASIPAQPIHRGTGFGFPQANHRGHKFNIHELGNWTRNCRGAALQLPCGFRRRALAVKAKT